MTKVDFALPDDVQADALAVPVTKPPVGELDARLTRLAETGELRGSRGDAVVLHGDGDRLVAAGVGLREEVDAAARRGSRRRARASDVRGARSRPDGRARHGLAARGRPGQPQ